MGLSQQRHIVDFTDSFLLQFDELLKWPATIEEAEKHERANGLGIPLENGVTDICKCCGMDANIKPFNWWKADIDRDLGYEYGTAIPAYFRLIKYYFYVTLILIAIIGIPGTYFTYKVCWMNWESNICAGPWAIPFIANIVLFKCMEPFEKDLLLWLSFTSYVIILFVTLFSDIILTKYQSQTGKHYSQQCMRTLVLKMIPKDKTEREVKKWIQDKAKAKGFDIDINRVFFAKDYSKYDDYWNERSTAFYKLKPIINNEHKGRDEDIIRMKAYIYFYNEYLNYENSTFGGKAIAICNSSIEAYNLRKYVITHNFGFGAYKGCISFFRGFNLCRKRAEISLNKMENI